VTRRDSRSLAGFYSWRRRRIEPVKGHRRAAREECVPGGVSGFTRRGGLIPARRSAAVVGVGFPTCPLRAECSSYESTALCRRFGCTTPDMINFMAWAFASRQQTNPLRLVIVADRRWPRSRASGLNSTSSFKRPSAVEIVAIDSATVSTTRRCTQSRRRPRRRWRDRAGVAGKMGMHQSRSWAETWPGWDSRDVAPRAFAEHLRELQNRELRVSKHLDGRVTVARGDGAAENSWGSNEV